MESYSSKMFLWFTGLDKMIGPSYDTTQDEGWESPHPNQNFLPELYDKIYYNLMDFFCRTGQNNWKESQNGVAIVWNNDSASIFINSDKYSPEELARDIKEYSPDKVIFLHAPRNYPKREYVCEATTAGYMFLSQSLPKFDYIPLPGTVPDNRFNSFMSGTPHVNIGDVNINIDNVNINVSSHDEKEEVGHGKEHKREERRWFMLNQIGNFVTQLLAGILLNACCVFSNFPVF